jgi:hypothetical protein
MGSLQFPSNLDAWITQQESEDFLPEIFHLTRKTFPKMFPIARK